MKRTWILLLALAMTTSLAYAHNGMTHVLGTVTALTTESITVKSPDGVTTTVVLAATTKYQQGTILIKINDIKIGQRVVIHAVKKDKKLVAAEVETAAAKATRTTGMDGMHMDGAKAK